LLWPRGNGSKTSFDFVYEMHCQPGSKDAGNEINEKTYENAFDPDERTRVHIKAKTLGEDVTREHYHDHPDDGEKSECNWDYQCLKRVSSESGNGKTNEIGNQGQ
jgi:hypothetical protein